MKKLFIVRHGQPGGYGIGEHGEGQIRRLAKQMRPLCQDSSVAVFTNEGSRIVQSAEILTSELSLPAAQVIHDLKENAPGETADWLILGGQDKDVVILVTYAEIAWSIPERLCNKLFNQAIGYPPDLQRGQAMYIDLETKTITIIGDDATHWSRTCV